MINLDLNRSALYGIYDKVSDTVVCVFMAANDSAAERQYIGLISAPDATIFALNSSDFDLVKFACDSFDVLKNSNSYSAGLIDKIRSERAAKFIDNAKVGVSGD